MADSLWVARLHISERTAQKLRGKHGLKPEDITDAVVCRTGLRYTWHDHHERGLRAIVETCIAGRKVLVILYPGDDALGGVYRLGSAYPT